MNYLQFDKGLMFVTMLGVLSIIFLNVIEVQHPSINKFFTVTEYFCFKIKQNMTLPITVLREL
jgi:hypothetical protein